MEATTTKRVSANVMESYNARERGERAVDIAKRLNPPITASTVSANHKRVKQLIDDGITVVADDGNSVAGATDTDTEPVPAVDPHAIAEAMHPGASLVTRALDALEAERDANHKRADDIMRRATEQADTLRRNADTSMDEQLPRITAVADALSFDVDAWRTAVQAAVDERHAQADRGELGPEHDRPTQPASTGGDSA